MSKKVKSYKNEEWKLIRLPSKHKSKAYYISSRARLKSVDKKSRDEQLVKTSPDRNGHLRCTIRLDNKKNHGIWIHKQVAKHFVEKPSRRHNLVIHKNYKRDDNRLKNLVWATEEEHKDYIRARHKALGYEYHRKGGTSKLNRRQVAVIKRQLAKGKKTKTKIANHYGVSITQIRRIETGENWAGVEAAK